VNLGPDLINIAENLVMMMMMVMVVMMMMMMMMGRLNFEKIETLK